MAGIYIHVPFCSKRCTYCDFFSSTNMQNKETYVDSVVKELELRKEYLSGEGIGTIYFGGGTPSQLDIRAFERIFETITRLYQIDEDAEITLGLMEETEYDVFVAGKSIGQMKTNLGGKLTLSVELDPETPVAVKVSRV